MTDREKLLIALLSEEADEFEPAAGSVSVLELVAMLSHPSHTGATPITL